LFSSKFYVITKGRSFVAKLQKGKVVKEIELANPAGYEITSSAIFDFKEDILLAGTYFDNNGILGTASVILKKNDLTAKEWKLSPFSAEHRASLLGDKNKPGKGFKGLAVPVFAKRINDKQVLLMYDFASGFIFNDSRTNASTTVFQKEGFTLISIFNADNSEVKQIGIGGLGDYKKAINRYYASMNDEISLVYQKMLPSLSGTELKLYLNAPELWLKDNQAAIDKAEKKKAIPTPVVVKVNLLDGAISKEVIKIKPEVKPGNCLLATGYHYEYDNSGIVFSKDPDSFKFGIGFLIGD
jgi:hypothetical protein